MRTGVIAAAAALLLAGCGGGAKVEVPGGDPDRGARAIAEYGCGACHTIPGIEDADSRVGPALTDFQDERYIAGDIPNTPENAIRWILDPQAIEPGTIMPDLDVNPEEAEDIVAYLYCCT